MDYFANRCNIRNLPNFHMLKRGAALIAAVIVALAFNTQAMSDELRQAPNSRVAIAPGDSFMPSDRFTGFIDEKIGASYVIVEMPAVAYDELTKTTNLVEEFTRGGLIEVVRRPLPERQGEFVYLTGKQKTSAAEYAKYVLVMRQDGVTGMITANIPLEALRDKNITEEQVKTALATATIKSDAGEAVELFKLSYLGEFKPSFTVMGTSKLYSLSGQIPEEGEDRLAKEPVFMVSPSIDKREIKDIKAVALHSFSSFGNFQDHKIESEKPVTIGGLEGYEIVGQAKFVQTGRDVGVYMVMLRGAKGGYFVMFGTTNDDTMATYLPEFQKMAASFELAK